LSENGWDISIVPGTMVSVFVSHSNAKLNGKTEIPVCGTPAALLNTKYESEPPELKTPEALTSTMVSARVESAEAESNKNNRKNKHLLLIDSPDSQSAFLMRALADRLTNRAVVNTLSY
jgi:hypothetical protein